MRSLLLSTVEREQGTNNTIYNPTLLENFQKINSNNFLQTFSLYLNVIIVFLREQQNALTHWIDLSSIYGSTEVNLEGMLRAAKTFAMTSEMSG